jgi:hypothetical protein
VDSYFPTPGTRKQIGYGGYFSNDSNVTPSTLTPEQRESLLEKIGGRTLQGAEMLLSGLNLPGGMLRGLATGTTTATGGEFLDALGMRPEKDTFGGWARPIADFAAEALTDPFTYVGPGLTRAASALKGAGMLDDATRVASKQLIERGDLSSRYAKNSLDSWWDNFGKGWKPGLGNAKPSYQDIADDLSDADLLARPVSGTIASRRALNLEDVVQAQSNVPEAVGKVDNVLKKYGQTYGDLAKYPLRHDIGIGLPFSDYVSVGMNLPGGEVVARNLDRAAQMARWSAPGRYAYSAFDRSVAGSVAERGQIAGTEVTNAMKAGEATGRARASKLLQRLDPSTLNDTDTGRAMRRILDGRPEPEDLTLINSRPDLQRFVDNWHGPGTHAALQAGNAVLPQGTGLAADYLQRRAVQGLASNPLSDEFGNWYFPRHADDMSFWSKIQNEGATDIPSAGKSFSTMTGDQMARQDPFKSPGGTELINKLSLDPQVAGPNRALRSDDDAAKYIRNAMNQEAAKLFPGGTLSSGNPAKYSMEDARRMARTLHQLDQNAIENGLPMFGANFTDDFSKYIIGNEKALSVASTLEDLLAGSAKMQKYSRVPGGGHVSMGKALKDLGLDTVSHYDVPTNAFVQPLDMLQGYKVGAKPQVAERLKNRFGVSDVKMGQVSIDKDVVSTLAKVADFYNYPEVQKDMLGLFDRFTSMWKATILAWPARTNRDWYAGAFTNYVELGSGSDTLAGYSTIKALTEGNWEEFDKLIAISPKYSQIGNATTRRRQAISDMAAAGVTSGRRQSDLMGQAQAIQSGMGVADDLLPGYNPRTTTGYKVWDTIAGNKRPVGAEHAASELTKGWDKFTELGFNDPRNVGNPILRWSAKAGDITDSINRGALYFGFIRQGLDPMEAGKRVLKAHVDYNSLTTFERNVLRRIIPFWSYTSRTGKWVAEQVFEHPGGRYANLGLRLPDKILHTEDDEYVPESIRSSYGKPVEGMLSRPFGGLKEGVTPWITDIDLPGIDQINMIKPGFQSNGMPSLTATAWSTGKDMLGKLAHPMLKEAAQVATGENFFTKRPLKEMETVPQQVAEDMLGIHPNSGWGQTIKNMDPFVNLVPFAPRVLQTTNRLIDSEKLPDFRDRLYQMGVNATSGVKFQNVDDQARRIDARKKIAEMMQDDPLVRNFNQTFIPEEAQPFVDPELMQMMALERQLGKELSREREIRSGLPPKKKRNTDPVGYFD